MNVVPWVLVIVRWETGDVHWKIISGEVSKIYQARIFNIGSGNPKPP